MRVGLIDIDYNGSFPNLALMKIAAWHKAKGDSVEWYMAFSDRYDIVYVAKVFSWSEDYRDCINADRVVRGGSGYNIQLRDGKEVWSESNKYMQSLPTEIEHTTPRLLTIWQTNSGHGFWLFDTRLSEKLRLLPRSAKRGAQIGDRKSFVGILAGAKKIYAC